jgi:3-oxoadipate enol-lactonase
VNFTEVNGTALRYDLLGSGAATLVLNHEMGGTIESWDLVAPMLSTKRRVLRYDTRGAGLSQKISPPLAIESMVDDLVARLDELGIAGKVAVLPSGGAIALHTAARCPQRVAAAVVSSPAIGIASDRRPALLARVEKMEREGLQAVIDTLDLGYPP